MFATIIFQLIKQNAFYQDNTTDTGQCRSNQGSKNPHKTDRVSKMGSNTGSKRLHKAVLPTHNMINQK